MASWCWLGALLARSSASSSLATDNKLGTDVQLNRDRLNPAFGPVAVDATRVMNQLATAVQAASESAT